MALPEYMRDIDHCRLDRYHLSQIRKGGKEDLIEALDFKKWVRLKGFGD